jgi:hypothetical protein
MLILLTAVDEDIGAWFGAFLDDKVSEISI